MNGRKAKELRKVAARAARNAPDPMFRRYYRELKRRYKQLPWNQRRSA